MLDELEKDFIKLVERCDKCEQLNMHGGVYMWCDEYNRLCADVINCTGKERKVRKW